MRFIPKLPCDIIELGNERAYDFLPIIEPQ
jgi:hypothetical protein